MTYLTGFDGWHCDDCAEAVRASIEAKVVAVGHGAQSVYINVYARCSQCDIVIRGRTVEAIFDE